MSENGNPNPLKQAIGALQKIEARLDKAVLDGPTGSFKHCLTALEDVAGTEAGNIRNVVEILKGVEAAMSVLSETLKGADSSRIPIKISAKYGDEWITSIKPYFEGKPMEHVEVEEDTSMGYADVHFNFDLTVEEAERMYTMLQMLAGLDMPLQYNQDIGMFMDGKRVDRQE